MLRRPFLGMFIALTLGVLLADYSDLFWVIGSASLFGGALLFKQLKKTTKNGIVGLVFVCLILFGFSYRSLEVKRYAVSEQRKNQSVQFEGRLYGLDVSANNRYVLVASKLLMDDQTYEIKETYRIYLNETPVQALNGHRVKLDLSDYEIDGVTNPGDFDYTSYLNSQGYYGQFYVRQSQIKDQGMGHRNWQCWLNEVRTSIYQSFRGTMDRDKTAVIYGMLLGDTRFIDASAKEAFKKVGIAHILAMSGLHFGILYGVVYGLQKKRQWKGYLWRPGLLLLLWLLAALNGFKPSALRAVVMISFLTVAPMLGRRYDVLNSMGLVGCASLVKYAGSIYQPGLQLSYIAVLSILYLTPLIKERLVYLPSDLKDLIALTLGVQLGMWPLLAYHFHYYSMVSYLANIPAVFLAGILVPLAFIHALVYFVFPILAFATSAVLNELLALLVEVSRFLSGTNLQGVYLPRPPLESMMLYLWLLICVVWHRQFERYFRSGRKKWGILLVVVPILFTGMRTSYGASPEILFWDVGQGDAALIRYLGTSLLMDTGEAEKKMYDKLLNVGVYPLDYLVLSHGHSDHAGGAVAIMEHIPVRNLVLGAYWKDDPLVHGILETAAKKNVNILWMGKGDVLKLAGAMQFKCLGPVLKNFGEEDAVNDNSLVFEMTYGGIQCLFTGDIEKEGEETLLKSADLHGIELLKVPHHGSDTSSSIALLETVQPETAIIQVGPNRYGHPNRAIIELYEEKGTRVYRTDENGAVKVIVHKDSYDIMTFVE